MIAMTKKDINKTVLVTGGAGYIGSRLVELLVNKGHNVVAVDNRGTDHPLFFVFAKWGNLPNFELINGDIASNKVIKSIFDKHKIDAVVHLAAIVGDPACARDPKLAEEVNWKASLGLLEKSIKNRVERFIFASTCSNYGKMPDPDGYVNEDSPRAPISLYAELKVKFEKELEKLTRKDNFCPTSLRFATAYGVSQARMRFDLTVNEFTKELTLGRELEVFGEQFWRPYCHVSDLAGALLCVLNSDPEKVAYNVFNVGDNDENYQKKKIVEEIQKVIPNPRVRYVKKDEDPRDYRVSFDKIKDKLGFNTSMKLRDGIKEVKTFVDNIKGNNNFPHPDDSIYRNS